MKSTEINKFDSYEINKFDSYERKVKKLPTIVAFLILGMGLVAGIFLARQIQNARSQASSAAAPKLIRITNVDSTSFVVSWITDTESTGSISLSEDSSAGGIRMDIRDNGTSNKYSSHFINAYDLKPSTKYYFKILSSGSTYDNGGKPYEITTAPKKTLVDNDIAQGRILSSNNQPFPGAIVYLSLANTIPLAAITDSNGHWMIPLSTGRALDLQNYSNYDREAQVEEIFVQGDKLTSSASLTTKIDNPAPDIVLGQTYDFINQVPEGYATPTLTQKQIQDLPQSGFQNSGENAELTITYPTEKENVSSPKPQFMGGGPKNQKITVQVNSTQTISSDTTIDSSGKWNWTPTKPLSPGNHQVTVSYTDLDGFVKKVTRSFTVLAAGESDLPSFTATPSGQTATPSQKLSPSPTPSPTKIPSISPTTYVKPTFTPAPTPTTEQVRTTIPSTEEGTPATGNFLPTKLFFGAGILTIIIGLALVFL